MAKAWTQWIGTERKPVVTVPSNRVASKLHTDEHRREEAVSLPLANPPLENEKSYAARD